MQSIRSQKIIVHLDMNSFFASVEQQANVTLRGKPLGVCAYLHAHGCIIAASIEAKKLGMKVGMSVQEARQRVPNAVFVQNDPAKYRAVTSRVFAILHEISDRVEHYSIDEAFVDLTGWCRDAAEAAWIMTRVRQRITREVGDWLRCSIGIAPTRFLAKTASDMEKPNGLVIIDQENLDDMLARLELQDVCGIGPRIARRLHRLGLYTLLEVKRYPIANLMRAFGIYGYFLHAKLHGIECEEVKSLNDALPKSIGHSYCVPQRVNHEGKVLAVLTKLTERAGRRLRSLGQFAGAVSITVGFRQQGFVLPSGPFWMPAKGEGGTVILRLGEPASDSFTLVDAACSLLKRLWHEEPVSFLAVTLLDLSSPTGQTRLSDVGATHESPWDTSPSGRRMRVSQTIDMIRDRYGDASILFASMIKLEHEAPDRIGFRKTEGVDISRTF